MGKRETRIWKGVSASGQSLVEFVMVAPILLLMLLGAFTLGMAMYQGSTAASAMQEVVMNKTALADVPGSALPMATQEAQGYQEGNIQTGSGVDSLQPSYEDNVTAILVGSKCYTDPLLSTLSIGAPCSDTNPQVGLKFLAVQGVNANLLKANNPTYSANLPAPPVLALPSPAAYGLTAQDIPPNLVLSEVCSMVGGGNLGTTASPSLSCQGLSQEECAFQRLVAYLREYLAVVKSTYPDICTETSLKDTTLYTLTPEEPNY